MGKVGAMMQGVISFKNQGLTLIELMVTVAVAAVLAMVAVPYLTSFVAKSQMMAAVNEFSGAIQTARLEAVSRNQCVSVCRRASSNMVCATDDGAWTKGWIVYTNPSCNPAAEANPSASDILRAQGAVAEHLVLNAETGDAPAVIVFTPRGLPLEFEMATRMAFTDQRGEKVAQERILALSPMGRLRPSTRSQKPEDPVVAEGQ